MDEKEEVVVALLRADIRGDGGHLLHRSHTELVQRVVEEGEEMVAKEVLVYRELSSHLLPTELPPHHFEEQQVLVVVSAEDNPG